MHRLQRGRYPPLPSPLPHLHCISPLCGDLWRPAAHPELLKILGCGTQWQVMTCFVPSLDAAFPWATSVWTLLKLCFVCPLASWLAVALTYLPSSLPAFKAQQFSWPRYNMVHRLQFFKANFAYSFGEDITHYVLCPHWLLGCRPLSINFTYSSSSVTITAQSMFSLLNLQKELLTVWLWSAPCLKVFPLTKPTLLTKCCAPPKAPAIARKRQR